MKITKEQLQKIIKEELANLSENEDEGAPERTPMMPPKPYASSPAFKVRQACLTAHGDLQEDFEAQGMSYEEANEKAALKVIGYVQDYLANTGMEHLMGRQA